MKNADLYPQARSAVLASLQTVPFTGKPRWKAETSTADLGTDARVSVQVQGRQYAILVEIKDNGQPRYAREAVGRLLLNLQRTNADYGVFVAPFISTRSAEICRANGIGYIDFAGNSFLSFDSIFIEKEGKPNPFKRETFLRSLFSPKSERILRVLLNSEPKPWKVTDLAQEAEVSQGMVSVVKKLLADQEWLGEGLTLRQPAALLEAWTQNYSFQQNEVFSFYSLAEIPDIEAGLEDFCRTNNIQFGLTGFSGAARFAPAVRYRQVMAYADTGIDRIAAGLELKPVDSGANVLILAPYDAGVFYGSSEVEGSRVVSPVQIYLDLASYRGRGEEAAEALFQQVIRKKW